MSRLFVACLVIVAAVPFATGADTPRRSRPNILFVFTDDHASHAIGAYGSKINKTPNMDRLAAEGMLFRNCFCTNSLCGPSRAVILTGKHSHLNGFVDNRSVFDGTQPHVGKLLGKAGYQTAVIGKWHLKSDPTGFDHWAVLAAGGGQGTYYEPEFRTSAGPRRVSGYVTDVVTDMALDWLKKRDPARPFFLMYQHKAPHRSWEPGPNQLGLYRDGPIPEPPTLFDDHAGLASPARHQEMTVANHLTPFDLKLTPKRNLPEWVRAKWNAAYAAENEAFRKAAPTGKELVRWKYQRYMKDYLRCVAGVDDNLGRVIAYLKENGLDRDTVVIYSSDQGFFLGDRGWYDKRWMYEESLRMPLIVRWPGVVKPGSENRDLAQNLDFAETFLDMAGVPAPSDMQGRSLRPLLEGKTPADWRKAIYYHYYEYPAEHMVQRHYGVRTATHKLIHYYLVGEWELFDLSTDPGERRSVYADPAYAGVVRELKAELQRLRKLYKADEYRETLPPERVDPRKVKPSLVLHLDVTSGKDGTVSDRAGKRTVKVVRARPVTDDGAALELGGDGHVAVAGPAPDPTGKPLTVGAWCLPTARRGVVVAQGGESHGYSLHLTDGVPTFSVRLDGRLVQAKAESAVTNNRWVHLAGVLDVDGRLRVWVDGRPSGNAVQAGHLAKRPADGLSVGADTGSLVGGYRDAEGWTGRLRDVRLYWGVPDAAELTKWSKRDR
ncbi:MAG: sulfatase-like hydrolase/transferase [Gemmataceae bacterium]